MKRRTGHLLLLTTGLAVAEAVVLQSVGFTSALPLAPQVSAPAGFAVYHDLRWVWTFAHSPWSTAWMLVALLVFRTSVNALVIRLAWPVELAPPGHLTLLRRSAVFTALAVVALSPWATLAFPPTGHALRERTRAFWSEILPQHVSGRKDSRQPSGVPVHVM